MPTIGLAVQRAGRVGTIATNTQWPTHGVGRAQDNPNGFRGNLAGAEPKHGWGTPLTTLPPALCVLCPCSKAPHSPYVPDPNIEKVTKPNGCVYSTAVWGPRSHARCK